MSSNIYDLLDNEQLHSKRPRETEGPGKPDKSDQRRSQPRARGGAAGPSSQSQQDRPRVEDRQRFGRGGQAQGGRGGRGGRGGYHGIESDGQHRNFDRKQGEHRRYAPGEARKHGAVGEVDPTHFHGSTSDFAEQAAVELTDANGDIIGDQISAMAAEGAPVLEVFEGNVDPDDALLTYDQYLRSKARPEDDVNRAVREVTNEGDFRPVKQLKREEEDDIFPDLKANKEKDESGAVKEKKAKQNKKNKISLDEFIGALPSASSPSPAPASSAPSFDSSRGGRGGFGASRGGRGGFSNDNGPRNSGNGNFNGNRGGGRGGRGGNINSNRGGRGGFARDNRQQSNVNFQQSDFPALQ